MGPDLAGPAVPSAAEATPAAKRPPRPLSDCPLPMHPLRADLQDELHARPFPRIQAPWSASHVVLLTGETGRDDEIRHLAELCRSYGVQPPEQGVSYFDRDFGGFRLRWERHTEFTSLTVSRTPLDLGDDPFERPTILMLPTEWLAGLGGEVVTATHLVMMPGPSSSYEDQPDRLHRMFEGHRLIASRPTDAHAGLWTACRIHGDGYGRILLVEDNLAECRAGRLAQRVLELETYRAMAMLALPAAREMGAELTRLDARVGEAIGRMGDARSAATDRELLSGLMDVAARVERLRAASAYRFNAALAYHALVEARLKELRERPIEGMRTWGEFLDRRLTPAMRTVESVRERLEHLSVRLDRATDLLRTRIDLELRESNLDMLASLDRRAQLQLRLQRTVEGLSVAAVSYYLLGLVHHALEGLHAGGLHVNPAVGTGVAMPIVIGGVWFGIRRLHQTLAKHGGHG